MSDRIDRLLDELARATDAKGLPVVRARDADTIVGMFHAQIDRGTEARAQAVAAAGRAIACTPGCARCCENIPGVHAGEASMIARWLARPEHDAIRDAFLERFEAWRAGLGDLVDRWIAATAAGKREAAMRITIQAFQRGVRCAFLDDERRCTIYPIRPVACREHHAVDTAARCEPDSAIAVEQAGFPPLDDYLERIEPIMLALHDALRPDAPGARPVCQAVHDELAAVVAG